MGLGMFISPKGAHGNLPMTYVNGKRLAIGGTSYSYLISLELQAFKVGNKIQKGSVIFIPNFNPLGWKFLIFPKVKPEKERYTTLYFDDFKYEVTDPETARIISETECYPHYVVEKQQEGPSSGGLVMGTLMFVPNISLENIDYIYGRPISY